MATATTKTQESQYGLAVPQLQQAGSPSSLAPGLGAAAALGALTGAAAGAGNALPPMPFKSVGVNGNQITSLKPENWNRVFPYSFALYLANPDGTVSRLISLSDTVSSVFSGINRINLNIPPSSLRWKIPFANTLTATAGGVLEETRGVVFRPLTIQGTTGLMPNRSAAGNGIFNNPLVKAAASFLPATSSAVSQLANQISSSVSSVVGPGAPQVVPDFDPSNANNIINQSGYTSFWLLSNFLVAYEEAKGTGLYDNIRLVFENPKDNIGYIVTPVSIDCGKDAQHTYLYQYNIQLTAWGVVDLTGAIQSVQPPTVPSPNNVGAIKAVANVIGSVRNAILGAQNVLFAAGSDVNTVFNTVQQTLLSVKQIVNLPTDISDFASSVKSNANQLFQGDFANKLSSVWTQQQQLGNPNAAQALGGSLGIPNNSTFSNQPVTTTPQGETINDTSAATQPPPTNSNLQTALNLALQDPTIASGISMTDFTAPPALQQAVNQLNTNASNTNANDIRSIAATLQTVSDRLSFATGSMDALYQSTFDLVAPNVMPRELTEDDVILQASLQESIAAYQSLLATGQLYVELVPDPFVTANQYLDPSAQLPSPLSAFPAVVEGGSSMDKLAQRYLGDANRSEEIIILNNLRAPYIDEVGFNVSMSGIGPRSCILPNVTNLTIGQKVTIQGIGVPNQIRNIVNIQPFGIGAYEVIFNGDSSLNVTFPQSVNPFFNARLPGCVGTNDIILIPSGEAAEILPTRPTYLQSTLTYAEQVFAIDLALGPNGDLMIGQDGDFVLSYGYNNAIQAIRLLLETGKGELEQYPNYGLPFKLGQRNSDLPPGQIQAQVVQAVTSDPRFFNASVTASVSGNVANVNVTAVGANNTGLIPVQFQVGLAAT